MRKTWLQGHPTTWLRCRGPVLLGCMVDSTDSLAVTRKQAKAAPFLSLLRLRRVALEREATNKERL